MLEVWSKNIFSNGDFISHQSFLKLVLFEISRRYPSIRVWQQIVGVGRALSSEAIIRYGLPGQADITGIMPDGKRLEIEIKVGRDKQSEKQINFQKMIEKNNGIYLLVKDDRPIEEQIQCLQTT